MEKRWIALSAEGWHHIIAGLVRERQPELALLRLREMRETGVDPEPWLLNLLIMTFLSTSNFTEIAAMLSLKISQASTGRPIPPVLWSEILSAAAKGGAHDLVSYVWARSVSTQYLVPSSGQCTVVLQSAARRGDIRLATDVIKILGQRSTPLAVHHYESLLEAYLAASDLRTALKVFEMMQSSRHPPTDATARPLYLFLRKSQSRCDDAFAILSRRRARPLAGTPNKVKQASMPVCVYNALIEARIDVMGLDSALDLYHILPSLCPNQVPTTHTFNVLLRECRLAERKDVALFLAAEMEVRKVAADELTYDRMILICLGDSDRQSLDDAWKYWERLRKQGWWPRYGTSVALANSLLKAGDDRAYELYKQYEAAGIDAQSIRRMIRDGPNPEWRFPRSS